MARLQAWLPVLWLLLWLGDARLFWRCNRLWSATAVLSATPTKTFRGNQALSRYEFAAGFNACLSRVNELLAAGTADLVKKQDLARLQTLQESFAAELATLRGRVDALEARSATLEAQQFSTTTRLTGQVIFGVNAGGFSSDRIIDPRGAELTGQQPNATFLYRAALDLNTSF